MIKILLATADRSSMSDLASTLERHDDVEVSWAQAGKQALAIIKDIAFHLVVANERLGDMTGFEFAEKLTFVNPMVNCALISSLSPKKFHEAGEGLGLLAQLPVHPGKQQAEDLLQNLKKIIELL